MHKLIKALVENTTPWWLLSPEQKAAFSEARHHGRGMLEMATAGKPWFMVDPGCDWETDGVYRLVGQGAAMARVRWDVVPSDVVVPFGDSETGCVALDPKGRLINTEGPVDLDTYELVEDLEQDTPMTLCKFVPHVWFDERKAGCQ